MPGVLQIQTDCGLNPTAVWRSNPNPEDVELWLPSKLPEHQRRSACVDGLPEMELQFRTAQCSSSLEGLRRALRVKTRMVYFKNKNVRGQREGTRSRSIIDRVHKRAIRFVQKYRTARQAKMDLEGPGSWEKTYRQLRNEDVRGYASGKVRKLPSRRGIWEDGHAPPDTQMEQLFDEDDESDPDFNEAVEAEAAGRPSKKRKRGTGETRKDLSWIWRAAPVSPDDDDGDNEILRAEWARSRARVRRCTEEVELLLEEMRRVLAFYEWKARQWDSKREGRRDVSAELREGIKAYAVEQAALQRSLSSTCRSLWKTPLASVKYVLPESDDAPTCAGNDGGDMEDDESEDEHAEGTENNA